jgi:hypothetical protein
VCYGVVTETIGDLALTLFSFANLAWQQIWGVHSHCCHQLLFLQQFPEMHTVILMASAESHALALLTGHVNSSTRGKQTV